mgnify:CR=1 FL=1
MSVTSITSRLGLPDPAAAPSKARGASKTRGRLVPRKVQFDWQQTPTDWIPGQPFASYFINEINTMPGFTPSSMYPRMWAESGVDYAELLTVLIDTALARGTGLR